MRSDAMSDVNASLRVVHDVKLSRRRTQGRRFPDPLV